VTCCATLWRSLCWRVRDPLHREAAAGSGATATDRNGLPGDQPRRPLAEPSQLTIWICAIRRGRVLGDSQKDSDVTGSLGSGV